MNEHGWVEEKDVMEGRHAGEHELSWMSCQSRPAEALMNGSVICLSTGISSRLSKKK